MEWYATITRYHPNGKIEVLGPIEIRYSTAVDDGAADFIDLHKTEDDAYEFIRKTEGVMN